VRMFCGCGRGSEKKWLLKKCLVEYKLKSACFPMSPQRKIIIKTFSGWTALSALRSGAPVKSRGHIYPILGQISFNKILDAKSISDRDFEQWHAEEISKVVELIRHASETPNQWGWAAKIINVYLKTAVYVGDCGSRDLRKCLHPPIDGGLWKGVGERFKIEPFVKDVCCVVKIKDIDSHKKYLRIIDGLREAAKIMNCTLIEVEQLWKP